MREEVDKTGMRPKKGQTTMILPVTFDYAGGRKDTQKNANLWATILGIVGAILCIGILFNNKNSILVNILLSLVFFSVFSFIIRFLLLKEGEKRREQINQEDSDYEIDERNFWGIYSIDDQYPYFCRYRNGKTGIFVRLNKDVILGKYSDAEFEHYEAIGDAYNLSGSSNIIMCHVDYTDFVGTDSRLEDSFAELGRVENPDVRDLLTDIYSFSQRQMLERITTFDVYAFLWSGSDSNAMATIQRILGCFMQANYRSFHILNNENDIRELTKTLMNLEDFSVESAKRNSFVTTQSRGIIPISVSHYDGTIEEINKTTKEKQEEIKLKEKEKEYRKEELKRRKKEKGKQDLLEDDEIIDLF